MSEPFVGEIRMFAGNFAPRGWAFCDGQLLATSQNDALFSLLGTIYGGDGRTTFGLPEMRGRVPVHQGTGPGLSQRRLGARYGAETETLTTSQLPSHNHGGTLQANNGSASSADPVGNVPANANTTVYTSEDIDTNFSSQAIANEGGSSSHNNLMPALCINFIIALVGIYPSRN